MTYGGREASVRDGAPVELYEFAWGAVAPLRYTSAAADYPLGADTYLAATLQRSQIEASAERARNAITITCARDFPVAELFRVAPPSELIAVTLRRQHRGDAEVAVIWQGRVLNCEWAGAQATLNCEPVSSSLRRIGLRRRYQRQCPHVLYGPSCGVVRATHSKATTVTGATGLVLEVAALDAKPYAGGFVEWTTPAGAIERRFIRSFSGLAITLTQAFQGIGAGAAVVVSPGCAHTRAMCADTYANLPNHGGFPFIPQKNPFDGTPVY